MIILSHAHHHIHTYGYTIESRLLRSSMGIFSEILNPFKIKVEHDGNRMVPNEIEVVEVDGELVEGGGEEIVEGETSCAEEVVEGEGGGDDSGELNEDIAPDDTNTTTIAINVEEVVSKDVPSDGDGDGGNVNVELNEEIADEDEEAHDANTDTTTTAAAATGGGGVTDEVVDDNNDKNVNTVVDLIDKALNPKTNNTEVNSPDKSTSGSVVSNSGPSGSGSKGKNTGPRKSLMSSMKKMGVKSSNETPTTTPATTTTTTTTVNDKNNTSLNESVDSGIASIGTSGTTTPLVQSPIKSYSPVVQPITTPISPTTPTGTSIDSAGSTIPTSSNKKNSGPRISLMGSMSKVLKKKS